MLVAAAALRLIRVPNRWDEVAWLYSAYPASTADALARGDLPAALTQFTGLHPPLWPLLHALSEAWAPIPLLWLLGAALASWMAVAVIGRVSTLAGLVLATSAVQLHYAAEVNQYPLAVAFVACAWASRAAVARGDRHWGWLAAAIAAAGWTHALAGLVAALAVVGLPRAALGRIVVASLAAALPLLIPASTLAGDAGTYRQPPFELELVTADWRARFGLTGLALLPFAAWGVRAAPAAAVGVLGGGAAWAALVGAGVAAPHQFPYVALLGPPFALLVAAGARARWAVAAVATISVLGGLGTARLDLTALADLPPSAPRAIDVALSEMTAPYRCEAGTPPAPSCAGDAVYLLAPPGLNDDDKRRNSTVLWRLPPWRAMPRVRPHDMAWGAHRFGQPRLVGGHVVYLNDHLRPTLAQAIAAHPRLWLVVYEQGRRAEFTTAVEALVGQPPVPVGPDHLYRLSAPGL